MATQIQKVIEKLDHIQSDVCFVKKRLVDVDCILTDDDISALEEAEEDFRSGKTKRL